MGHGKICPLEHINTVLQFTEPGKNYFSLGKFQRRKHSRLFSTKALNYSYLPGININYQFLKLLVWASMYTAICNGSVQNRYGDTYEKESGLNLFFWAPAVRLAHSLPTTTLKQFSQVLQHKYRSPCNEIFDNLENFQKY